MQKCSFKTEHKSIERTQKKKIRCNAIYGRQQESFLVFSSFFPFASLRFLTWLYFCFCLGSSSIFVKMASGENTYKRAYTHRHTSTHVRVKHSVALAARFGPVRVFVWVNVSFRYVCIRVTIVGHPTFTYGMCARTYTHRNWIRIGLMLLCVSSWLMLRLCACACACACVFMSVIQRLGFNSVLQMVRLKNHSKSQLIPFCTHYMTQAVAGSSRQQ